MKKYRFSRVLFIVCVLLFINYIYGKYSYYEFSKENPINTNIIQFEGERVLYEINNFFKTFFLILSLIITSIYNWICFGTIFLWVSKDKFKKSQK